MYCMIKILKEIYILFKSFNEMKTNIINMIYLSIKKVRIKGKVSIYGRIYIYGKGKIILSDGVVINSHIKFNPIGGQSGSSFLVNNGKIFIGKNTGMSNVSICSFKSVVIGNDVTIGGNVKIYDTDFHSLRFECRKKNIDSDIVSKEVIIKDGAFIGGHSLILKGVTIGKKSIVGAGSVVTKSIPDNQIWAGNPAKFIRNID